MKTIQIDFSKKILKTICRQGEKNTVELSFVVPADFAGADYVNAEFKKPSGKKEIVELLDPAGVFVPMTEGLTCEAGRIGIQLTAYKVEGDEIIEIAKSPIVYGVIERSLGGSHHAGESVIERIIAFINEWREKLVEMWNKKHTHSNKNLLDSLTADDVGIKPDWDENDDESKNYIANRTHYKKTERTALNESWSYDSQESYWVPAASYDVVNLVEGEEYTVLYENQSYTFTAEALGDGIVVIGNTQIADPEYIPSPGDFPFVFAFASDGSYEANNFSALASLQGEIVSFGIVRESTVYHPLDVDYLPGSAKDAIELKHTHANKTILDNFSTSTAYPFTFLEYGGHTVPQFPINDVAPTTEGGNDYYLNWINPNVWYRFGSSDSPVTSISIYQLQGVDDSVAEEFVIEFWTGATAPSPVIFPSDVEWPDGSEPVWAANKHYQVSIVGNMGLYAEADYGEEE